MVSCRPQWAVGTAIYYCHRFFARKSMKKNDRFVRPPPLAWCPDSQLFRVR